MKVLVRGKEGSRVAEKSSSQVSLTRRWFPRGAAVGQDSSCIIYSPCIIWMAPVYRASSPAFNHNIYMLLVRVLASSVTFAKLFLTFLANIDSKKERPFGFGQLSGTSAILFPSLISHPFEYAEQADRLEQQLTEQGPYRVCRHILCSNRGSTSHLRFARPNLPVTYSLLYSICRHSKRAQVSSWCLWILETKLQRPNFMVRVFTPLPLPASL